MHFDDSLFETSSPSSVAKETRDSQPPYSARVCDHEWFVCEDGSHCETVLEECTLLKYKADLFYRKKQFSEAGDLYAKVLGILPPTHSLLKREIRDSVARCYLRTARLQCALAMARLLVSPPHEKDCSSWQLLAQCHCALRQHDSEIIALQTALTLQRGHPPLWTELAEAYSHYRDRLLFLPSPATPSSSHTLLLPSDDSSRTGSTHDRGKESVSSCEKLSIDFENLGVILSNTVALLRPYFALGRLAMAGMRGEVEEREEEEEGEREEEEEEEEEEGEAVAEGSERMMSIGGGGRRWKDTLESVDTRMRKASDDVIVGGGITSGCQDTAVVVGTSAIAMTSDELRLREGNGASREGLFRPDDILTSKCHDTGNPTLRDRIGGVKGQFSLFSCLLTRQMSSDEFVRQLQLLPRERPAIALGTFCEMATCSCLLWARQLLVYSGQCSHSFAESAQRAKLETVEQQLKHCHSNTIHFLSRHFKQTSVFDDTTIGQH